MSILLFECLILSKDRNLLILEAFLETLKNLLHTSAKRDTREATLKNLQTLIDQAVQSQYLRDSNLA